MLGSWVGERPRPEPTIERTRREESTQTAALTLTTHTNSHDSLGSISLHPLCSVASCVRLYYFYTQTSEQRERECRRQHQRDPFFEKKKHRNCPLADCATIRGAEQEREERGKKKMKNSSHHNISSLNRNLVFFLIRQSASSPFLLSPSPRFADFHKKKIKVRKKK